jgi:hypothetical protein
MSLITVIGRGHSGTRAISHTLYASGVYMGSMLNPSGDLLPPQAMYDACRILARYVRWQGGLNWDFSALHTMDIPSEFTDLLTKYLDSVLKSNSRHKGWKIPETTLIYPWLVRLYPEIHYIFWVRNPRDCILDSHPTDDLTNFGISYPATDDLRLRRAISWKYQYDIVRATPPPAHWIEVRFEDFVLKQEETLARLEDFLGIPLARIIVRRESLERWKHDTGVNYFDFFEPAMRRHGYEIPEVT